MSVIASERMVRVNPLRRLLVRPEIGAVVGTIAVWIFFAIVGVAQDNGFVSLRGVSSYLSVSADIAIVAVPVALLMIGGEFDLSIGSMVGAAGMIIAILSTQYGWNIWASIVVALIFAVLVGMLNGYLVMRTRLPSFIVTLGTAYILLGVTTGVTTLVTGLTVVNGLDQAPGYSSAQAIFATALGGGQQFPIEIIWALALVALATWLLLGTSFGNWIFGVGGDAQAARNTGVPVTRVKILLFVGTAVCACLLAIIQDVTFTNADVLRGQNLQFQAIVAAVVGGVLLTGGYGSAIGAMFGALVFGIVQEGIVFSGVDANWYIAFIGLILLLAVMLNSYVRKLAMEARR
jgi:simple sugar transport system permease protein